MESGELAVLGQVLIFMNVEPVLSGFETGDRTGDRQLRLPALLREGDLAADGSVLAGDLDGDR